MIIKRTIKFSIQNQRNAGSRLRMRVSYNGCRVDFQTGIVLNKEYWDDVQQRVLPLNSNVAMATDRNDQLLQMLTDMIAVFREYEVMSEKVCKIHLVLSPMLGVPQAWGKFVMLISLCHFT